MSLENLNNFLVIHNDVPPASKHHSSNEFPVLGPTIKNISHQDKAGTSPLESQSSSQCPGGKLKQDWHQQFTEILNMMQFEAVSEVQRTSSLSTGLAVCVPVQAPIGWKRLKTEVLHHLLSVPAAHRKLKLLGKQASSTGKPKPACEPLRGLFVTPRAVWWRSVASPFTPEWTSPNTVRGVGGSGQGRKPSSCTLNEGAACPLNLSVVPQPNQLESHLLPTAKPPSRRDTHTQGTERVQSPTSKGISSVLSSQPD